MKRWGRQHLLLIVAFLALPFVVASALFYAGWRPGATVHHGDLIIPPAPLSGAGEWQGRWSLLLVHDAPCKLPCLLRLDELQRLRISLGQEMQRTRLVWTGAAIAAQAVTLQAKMPDLAILERLPDGLSALPPGSVILVDPAGRAMMRYLPGADARGLRADLERLLKYARSA